MSAKLLLSFLFAIATLYAADARLHDYPKATDWEIAAEAGDADAMYNLAVIYHKNVKDLEKAKYWYKMAYEKDKGSDAASNLGVIYSAQKQYDKAEEWYKLAIDAGDKDAAYNLAIMYDIKLKQVEKAIPYYEKAYQLGDKEAPISLGLIYKKKYKDYNKATEWYKKAYNMGNMGGAHGLGYLCELTFQDSVCAKEWYGKAAKSGYADSINNLGILYHEQGDNVRAAAYYLAWIAYGEPKNDILNFLKNDWKLDRDTLQKAYELQKTLDIPKHYTGGID